MINSTFYLTGIRSLLFFKISGCFSRLICLFCIFALNSFMIYFNFSERGVNYLFPVQSENV